MWKAYAAFNNPRHMWGGEQLELVRATSLGSFDEPSREQT